MTHSVPTSPVSAHSSRRTGQLARIGKWEVIDLLGEGSWSSVYLARPVGCREQHRSDYVLKVAKQGTQDDRLAKTLLRREAMVGKMVSHPHLISVLSSQIRNVPCYLVMPYLEAVCLQTVLDRMNRLSMPQSLWFTRQIAESLEALHSHQWLHSDIKPDNVLVGPDGHVTLIDLGLATRLGSSECGATRPLVGTLHYCPPELFGTLDEIGPHSDVYSLGVLLYQMLTGGLPFDGSNVAQLAESIIHCSVPEPRDVNPHISPRIVQLLRKMLAKQPDHRPNLPELIAWIADIEIETFGQRFAA